jgi:hypothetical protein
MVKESVFAGRRSERVEPNKTQTTAMFAFQ